MTDRVLQTAGCRDVMSIESRIGTLEDRIEIQELNYKYCRYLDQQEWDKWLDLFSDDIVCDYEAVGTFEGKEELKGLIADQISEHLVYSFRVMYQPILEISSDHASGHWYAFIYDALTDGTAGWRHGQYNFEYTTPGDEWKISHVEHKLTMRKRYSSYERVDDDLFEDIISIPE